MLARASQLPALARAGREVTPASASSPRCHLLAALARGCAGRPLRRAPEPLDTAILPRRLSLAFPPPWPTPPQPPRRSSRAHRRPRAVPPCPTAPPSPTPSSRSSPERSLAPKPLLQPRLRRSPSEIPSAITIAAVRPRPRRPLRRNHREPGHLPILSSLSLKLCSHRKKLTRMRRRTSSSPTRLRPSNGRTTVAVSSTASPGARSTIARPSPCSLATGSTTPVPRQPHGSSPASIPATPSSTTTTSRRGLLPATRRCSPPSIWSPEEESRTPPPRLDVASG